MHTIRPAKGYLFAQQDKGEEKTQSGILLTESAQDHPKTATVINVGEGVTQFGPHDRITYKEYTTSAIKLNGEEYILIREDDVLGTVLEVQDENTSNR